MSDLDVAVGIVTYKSAELTVDCLRSIEAERSTRGIKIRVVVVDNASADAPIVAQAIQANGWSSWVTLLEAPTNAGFASGTNLAFEEAFKIAPPDYLYMVNPDTVLRQGAIGALVTFLEAHPHVGIVGSSFENADGTEWPIAFRFPSILSELEEGLQFGLARRLLERWVVAKHMGRTPQPIDWVPGASMMIRREVFDALGGFDENYFLYFEETDFCFRARKAGFATWYVPESRVMHIAGQSTKVTERNTAPKRLPEYWFESRRRYFLVTYGASYAIIVDVVAVVAHGLGYLKLAVQGRTESKVPHFLPDLFRHSALWPSNRKLCGRTQFASHP